jgi:L-ascorbate metabolism protein UlaG (beta-lactamase superfamily)
MTGRVELTWLGHAAFALRVGDTSILIDPWITGNPSSPGLPDGFEPEVIVLTHGHRDHVGDTLELVQRHGCSVVAVAELANYCERQGATVHRFNVGGWVRVADLHVKCVPAVHSSAIAPDGVYGGTPCGVVIETGQGTLYHAGDTEVFLDMQLIGELTPVDLALLPIGGVYTMDAVTAVRAVELLRPRMVAAMHHSTFPALEQDAAAFGREVEARTSARYVDLVVGEPMDPFSAGGDDHAA